MGDEVGNNGQASVGSLLKSARDAAFVVGIYLFFTGFAYREYYLTALAGPVSSKSSIEFAPTVVYAYRVFSAHTTFVYITVAVAVVAAVIAARFGAPVWLQRVRLAVGVGLVVLFFPLFNDWALGTAQADAQQMRLGLANVPPSDITFLDAAAASKYPQAFRDQASTEGVTVIGGTDSVTYVLFQPQAGPCDNVPIGYVYAIRNADIRYYVEIQPEISRGNHHATVAPSPQPCPQRP